jgi:hypothetical protein
VKTSSPPQHLSQQPSRKVFKSERTRAAILKSAIDFIWSHLFRDMTVNSLMAGIGLQSSKITKIQPGE